MRKKRRRSIFSFFFPVIQFTFLLLLWVSLSLSLRQMTIPVSVVAKHCLTLAHCRAFISAEHSVKCLFSKASQPLQFSRNCCSSWMEKMVECCHSIKIQFVPIIKCNGEKLCTSPAAEQVFWSHSMEIRSPQSGDNNNHSESATITLLFLLVSLLLLWHTRRIRNLKAFIVVASWYIVMSCKLKPKKERATKNCPHFTMLTTGFPSFTSSTNSVQIRPYRIVILHPQIVAVVGASLRAVLF